MNNKTKQLLDRVKSLEGDDTEPLLDSDDYGDDCEHTRMAEINGTTFCTSCGIESTSTIFVSGYGAHRSALSRSKSSKPKRGPKRK